MKKLYNISLFTFIINNAKAFSMDKVYFNTLLLLMLLEIYNTYTTSDFLPITTFISNIKIKLVNL